MKKHLRLAAFFGVVCLGMIFVMIAFIFNNNQRDQESYRIGIVIANTDRYEKIAGMKEGLVKLGFEEKREVQYVQVDFKGSRDEKVTEQHLLELKKQKPDVIVTTGAWETISAKKVLPDVPIVFIGIASPKEWGLIQSGDLITGIDNGQMKLIGKRMELIKQFCPSAKRMLVVADRQAPLSEMAIREARKAGSQLHLQLDVQTVGTPEELASLIRAIEPEDYQALFPLPSLLLEEAIVSSMPLLIQQKLFVVGAYPEQVKSGVFAAYGISFFEQGKQSATLVAKLLNGFAVHDLPVEIPDNVNLSINEQSLEQVGIHLSQQQEAIIHQRYGATVR